MCGIAGIWDPNGYSPLKTEELPVIARGMADLISHRGPDGDGVWHNPQARLAFSHRRLAILDLKETGKQPMSSADGRWVITFNGELYNHLSIRSELIKLGCNFRGSSDTEVLVEAIALWGIHKTLKECRGMFAFAAWDNLQHQLILARDRIGEKPLHFALVNGAFVFASELKAFSAIPGWNPRLNHDAIWDYLDFGYVCGDKAIYEGVQKIRPATYVTLSSHLIAEGSALNVALHSQTFWNLSDKRNEIELPDSEAIELLESRFENVIADQIIADVPVGAFLSGGLDSSLVVALASRVSSSPVNTFTIGFNEDSHNEAPWAKRIARHLGTNHHELILSNSDLLDALPVVAAVYDEPFADVSQIPTYLISRFASQHVKVALTGDGGDELFCGYNRHLQFSRAARVADAIPAALRPHVSKWLKVLPVTKWDQLVRLARRISFQDSPLQSAGVRVHKFARFLGCDTAEQRYAALLSTGAAEDIFGKSTRTSEFAADLVDLGAERIESQLMRLDLLGYLPDDGLVKVDRASMANGLEARAPFIDHPIVELAQSLPMHQKMRKQEGKWILRQILSKHLPPEFFQRPKSGFSVPIAEWLRGPLGPWLSDALSETRLNRIGLFDHQAISTKIAEHQSGKSDHSRILWALLVFDSWMASTKSQPA